MESYTCNSARHTLGYAQAVHTTLKSKIETAKNEINEMEEELGCLRIRKAMMEVQVSEADDQIAMVWEMLNWDGIPEVSLSDDEDNHQLSDFCQYPLSSWADPLADSQSSSSNSHNDDNYEAPKISGNGAKEPLSKQQEVLRGLRQGMPQMQKP